MQHMRILAVGSIVCGGIVLGRTSVALRHVGSTLEALGTSVALREHIGSIQGALAEHTHGLHFGRHQLGSAVAALR